MKKTLTITLAVIGVLFPTLKSLRAEEGHQNHAQNETMEMNHSSEGHGHHRALTIQQGQPIPNVDLIVHQDPVKGWNLEIKLDNFAFTPENVNQENQPNEGHAHLYVNGEQISRVYGNWYHLPELPSGNNEIKIGLNTNAHESLMYQGQTIEDSETIEVP